MPLTELAKNFGVIAIGVVAAALAFSQQEAPDDFTHVVRLNKSWSSADGDSITVEEVRGPSSTWITGAKYEVTGTYELISRREATLSVYVTSAAQEVGEKSSPQQVMRVSQGSGKFRLLVTIRHDIECGIGGLGPHVDFYYTEPGQQRGHPLIGNAYITAALACTQKKAPDDFTHIVRLNKTWSSADGDSITVEEVRGPSSNWITGAQYEVVGRYKLTSRDKAGLGVFLTTSSRRTEPPVSQQQAMEVFKGEGQFRLRVRIWYELADCGIGSPCGPHVSLYPVPRGEAFLDAYF